MTNAQKGTPLLSLWTIFRRFVCQISPSIEHSPPLSPALVRVPGTATLSHLCPSAHVPGEMDLPGCVSDPGLTTAMTNGRFRGRVMKCITRCQSSVLSPRWQPAIIYSAYISLVFHSFAALNGGMWTLWRSCLHRVYLSRIFDEVLMIFFGIQFLITNDIRKISLSTKTRSHY